nr:MAG TPA: hypothetical protein [Caudoviricetes sp.]
MRTRTPRENRCIVHTPVSSALSSRHSADASLHQNSAPFRCQRGGCGSAGDASPGSITWNEQVLSCVSVLQRTRRARGKYRGGVLNQGSAGEAA